MAGRGNGHHGCDYNDILHVLIPPATHHIVCTMPLYTHGDAYTTVCMDGWMDGWIDACMIPLFEHNVCNEIAMPGIGAHKNGSLAVMWLELLVFVH